MNTDTAFNNKSICTDKFKIIESEHDNACLYKSLSNGLNNIYKDPDFNSEKKAIKIQSECYNWVISNENFISNTGETIKQLISREHFECETDLELDYCFEQYAIWYKYYAALSLKEIIEINQDLKDSEEIIRWGGIPEIIAFGIIYNYNINIYMPKRFNPRSKKINNGQIIKKNGVLKPCKNVRYILHSTFDSSSRENNEINLLYRHTRRYEHYDLLIENEINDILEK